MLYDVLMPLLSVSHLSLTLNAQQILKNVTFDVDQGEVVGLIGPNGSGKTTLFNVLSGFLKPTHGTVHLREADITHVSPAQRAKLGIGRVFQNFGIFREMTLEENVLVALEALPKEQRMLLGDLREVVRGTLDMVGLSHQGKKKAGSLSGGQMRLLEIARTLKSGKELFLLDEPTAGVSPKMTKQVADLIAELKKEGKTVLIIEHDLPFISRICDRVLVLDVGEVVLNGKPGEIKHDKKLQEIYFGADPTA
ncbi:ABC transporter ATP-binding protein [Candidatus Peribacteria bacterium]|nr:ABC transporter ATP-binding protein [Candidatus Peribacteria bacterium]